MPICLHRSGKVHDTAESQFEQSDLRVGQECVYRGIEVSLRDILGLE